MYTNCLIIFKLSYHHVIIHIYKQHEFLCHQNVMPSLRSMHELHALLNLHMRLVILTWNSGVSLIAGMEYGTERWNGKWNGTVNIHSYS